MTPSPKTKRSFAYGGSYAIDAAVLLMMGVFISSLFLQDPPSAEETVYAYPMLTDCETCAVDDKDASD